MTKCAKCNKTAKVLVNVKPGFDEEDDNQSYGARWGFGGQNWCLTCIQNIKETDVEV